MNKDSRILVLGARGLVGSTLTRLLGEQGYTQILTPSRKELELKSQDEVFKYFFQNEPEYVFLAAAKVGGIQANAASPADFIHTNLLIQCNVLHMVRWKCIKKVLFLGSSCIYPKNAPQPMKEEHLLSGLLEESNKPYAVAKIAGITMCEAINRQDKTDKFVSAMPTNLYGPGDNFDVQSSHVLPAFIRKFHDAKLAGHPSVTLWGTGSPRRELLYVDDLASACILLMQVSNPGLINIGTGTDIAISDLARLVQQVVGYQGEIVWDSNFPDGTPRKLLETSKIQALGWKPKVDLLDGITRTYQWFLANQGTARL